ncbi:hypothetical protein Tsubulata_015916 [Turnera subulata]|uniref:Uncharacterized protein n=1 Tax=Turnera subulata TaxID=218843 RepID=A0A9Q0F6C3_9ROSI|nr:hypothetical protein Tsubulata_015916 [Turnera subulata]
MSGDNFTEKRAVLGDLTNRPLKREFSKISGDDSGLKSGDGDRNNMAGEDGDSRLTKQVCSRVEIPDKDGCKNKISPPPTQTKADASQENVLSVASPEPNNEANQVTNLLDDSADSVKSGTMTQSSGEGGDASRDSCASTGSMTASFRTHMKDGDDEVEKGTSDVILSSQVDDSHVCSSDDKDFGGGGYTGGKFGPPELPMLPKLQGSKSFQFNRCTALEGDSCGDLPKSCSCSFCLTAAYIWADLYYQDMKGRISALKKSQKEASILVNKYAMGKKTDAHIQGDLSDSSKLESDLTGQWRSLFRHMEDMFADENSQLQASFATLKELRENCKLDLERTVGVQPDKC